MLLPVVLSQISLADRRVRTQVFTYLLRHNPVTSYHTPLILSCSAWMWLPHWHSTIDYSPSPTLTASQVFVTGVHHHRQICSLRKNTQTGCRGKAYWQEGLCRTSAPAADADEGAYNLNLNEGHAPLPLQCSAECCVSSVQLRHVQNHLK